MTSGYHCIKLDTIALLQGRSLYTHKMFLGCVIRFFFFRRASLWRILRYEFSRGVHLERCSWRILYSILVFGRGPPRILLLLLDLLAHWYFQCRNKEKSMELESCLIRIVKIRMIRMLIKTRVNMNDREAINKDSQIALQTHRNFCRAGEAFNRWMFNIFVWIGFT